MSFGRTNCISWSVVDMHGVQIAKLLFTDTNSLMYQIKTEDTYEDFGSDIKYLVLVIIRLR